MPVCVCWNVLADPCVVTMCLSFTHTRDAPGGLVGAVSLLLVLLVLLRNTIQMVSHRVVQKCSVRDYDETHP